MLRQKLRGPTSESIAGANNRDSNRNSKSNKGQFVLLMISFRKSVLLGTAFWEAFNYVHHCTVVDAMRGQS